MAIFDDENNNQSGLVVHLQGLHPQEHHQWMVPKKVIFILVLVSL